MRIISGNFKGKKLFLPKDKKTRPLKDIVKESIFNLIQHSKKINLNIEDSLVLDLFSGTGSFGIECLSRGSKKVTFFENYNEAINVLEKNLNSLKNVKNYEIYKQNFFSSGKWTRAYSLSHTSSYLSDSKNTSCPPPPPSSSSFVLLRPSDRISPARNPARNRAAAAYEDDLRCGRRFYFRYGTGD